MPKKKRFKSVLGEKVIFSTPNKVWSDLKGHHMKEKKRRERGLKLSFTGEGVRRYERRKPFGTPGESSHN